MTSTQQLSTLAAAGCEVAFDNLTRQLYATDASLYQVEPVAVAFPRGIKQACAIMRAAAEAGVSMIPRGAGTGLTGGALGEGLVIDFARYNRQIMDLDLEKRTVRVGPGVVLDQLNQFLKPHGLRFGPDVATSSRATIGGMIANNSSGAYASVYGTTADHVSGLDLVLSNGQFARVGESYDTIPRQRELVEDLAQLNALLISECCPPGLIKRWPGYGLDRAVREPGNLVHVLCGSEGTLAAIVAAELKLVPVPAEKGLALIFFDSVIEAMQAAVELLDLKPAAIEHMDRILIDQTAGQLEFKRARDLLNWDAQPCESVLAVEFFDNARDGLAELNRRRLGIRKKILHTREGADLVWALRKAGLALLTSRKGSAKPLTGIEDAAVRLRQLPEYVKALQSLLGRLGLQASFYGHVASGLLHVRPVLDLYSREDLGKFRQVANEVSAIVREFKGSLAAEHGVGIARTEFMEAQMGEQMMDLMRQIKNSFDPHNLLNPGKIIPDGRYEIDSDLRRRPGHELDLPFEPVLAFALRDESFVGNLEQCNGCGGCLKMTPTMCPTFIATGREIMSPRGRANAIRAALERRGLNGIDPLASTEIDMALSNCLSCRACVNECPSNVDIGLLKAELQYARIQKEGLSWRERLFSSVDRLGRWGCKMPRLANMFLDSSIMRFLGTHLLGVTAKRSLPHYARQRFDHWFASRRNRAPGPRGRVILWDDTFVRYYEPHIGKVAVRVLEAAGFEVTLAEGRKCCGRPAFSQGNLGEATAVGAHNLELLGSEEDRAPILFLEPSCYSMFVRDYRELNLPNVDEIAARCFLFEEFIELLLSREPGALRFNTRQDRLVIHPHCHARSLMNPEFMRRLGDRLPERTVALLDAGCCGMAGGFGMMESKYELSIKVAEPLVHEARSQPYGTTLVMAGFSCRQQVTHLAPVKCRHFAEVLAEAIE
ncbi:MAG TPA: FAD-binding protein [Verrucomicrobia bacterium]|nr:FAD-binding protein [Verrucomicrobiota bacterium]HOP98090.1 FAD-linked oxidase C-terminal domain-containing protein [Verrucomicrobiota bacterium]